MKPLFYCDQYEIPLPPGHKFPVRKYALVREMLARDGLFRFEEAPLADPGAIRLVHDAAYVEAFLHGTLSAAAVRRIGFPWSKELVLRTLASVGGTLSATDEALRTGWGGNLAGGTHHAFRSEGAGFCVFNDIAVAIASLRARGTARRFAVIDLDVHQGDGTASIFAEDDNVMTASVHCAENFPFRKQQGRMDLALPAGAEDRAYLEAVDYMLPAVRDFRPDVILYQAGVDALESDTLGRLRVSEAGLRERDRRVMKAVLEFGVPFVVTLGGGYSRPIELTARAHANVFRTAAEVLGTAATSGGLETSG